MWTLTHQQKIEKLRQRTDFAMFSRPGDLRVRTIVIRAFKKHPTNVESAYAFAESALSKLSYEERNGKQPYGEAMDTAVRDSVYSTLEGIIGRG